MKVGGWGGASISELPDVSTGESSEGPPLPLRVRKGKVGRRDAAPQITLQAPGHLKGAGRQRKAIPPQRASPRGLKVRGPLFVQSEGKGREPPAAWESFKGAREPGWRGGGRGGR